MDAPWWNGEPGALFSDDDHRHRGVKPLPVPVCFDCHDEIHVGATHTHLATFCRLCALWRSARGLLFDARPRTLIERRTA